LEDVCIYNNGVLEVSTSRSTASSSNSSNSSINNTATISTQLVCLPTNRSLHPTSCRNCPQQVLPMLGDQDEHEIDLDLEISQRKIGLVQTEARSVVARAIGSVPKRLRRDRLHAD